MAEGQADRVILFRVKVGADDANDAALAKVRDAIKAAYRDANKERDKLRGAASRAEIQQAEFTAQRMARIRQQADNRYAPNAATRQAVAATAASVRMEERAAAERDKIRAKEQREQNKRTIDGLRQQERELAERERNALKQSASQQREERRQAKAQQTLLMATARMTSNLTKVTDGALSAARGMAMLGVAGEKDTQKLLEGLIKVQAGFEIVRGGASLATGAIKTYTSAMKVTAAAGAAGVGVPLLAKAVVAGSAALPWAAAIGGTLAAGLSGYQTYGDIKKYGFMGGAAAGSWRDWIGQKTASGLSYLSRAPAWMENMAGDVPGLGPILKVGLGGLRGSSFSRMYESNERTRRLVGERDKIILARGRMYEEAEPLLAGLAAQRAIALQGRYAGLEDQLRLKWLREDRGIYRTPGEQQLMLARRGLAKTAGDLGIAGGELGEARAGVAAAADVQALVEAQKRHAEAKGRVIELLKQQLDLTRAVAEAERQAAREQAQSIRTRQQELRDRGNEIFRGVRSFQERYGGMDASQREEFKLAMRAVQAGTATAEQEELVAGMGPQSAQEKIRRQRMARAEADADIREMIRPDMERAIRTNQQAAALEREVKVKQDFIIKIDDDAGRLMQAISAEIAKHNEKLFPMLRDAIQNALQLDRQKRLAADLAAEKS